MSRPGPLIRGSRVRIPDGSPITFSGLPFLTGPLRRTTLRLPTPRQLDHGSAVRVKRRPKGRSALEGIAQYRSEEHTSELQSPCNLVCRLLLEKKKKKNRECDNIHISTDPDVAGLLVRDHKSDRD